MKLLDEFKAFALKGNVVDLAVAVIIGGAFGAIVTSFTNDLIMPPIGWLIGGIDFTSLSIALPPATEGGEPVLINYGNFIQVVINFLIIAMSIFFAIKLMGKLRRKEEAPAESEKAPEPTKEEVLLTEIRDLLKEQNKRRE